jgi:hypothetical protein
MTTSAYFVGSQKQLKVMFTNIADAPVDPATIDLTIREPDGVLVAKVIGDLDNPTTGTFTYDYTITKAGRHVVSWVGTAGTLAAFEQEFYGRRKEAQ